MVCTNCGAENSPDASFCSNCGTPVGGAGSVIYCTNCGGANPGDSQFCGSCGSELAGSPSYPGAGRALSHGGGGDAGIRLPPRDLGELLQDTFNMYRDGFRFYVKIGLIAQIPFLVTSLISLPLVLTIVFTLGSLLVGLGIEGAIIAATAWHYLGLRPTVRECYRRAWDRYWTLLVAAFVLGVVLLVCGALSIFVVGIPLFFYFAVSRYFFPAAIILEDKGAIDALARSANLVKDTWWRIFGIGIFFTIIVLIVSVGFSIPGTIIGFANSSIGNLLTLIAGVIVLPISHIATTLVYFDLRTRKEVFTLGMLEAEMA